MKISLPQSQFLKRLQVVEHAVNDRSTLPILANVLLETYEGELVLTATDLDVGIQCRFPLNKNSEKGSVALPARKLTTIVKELPGEEVVLESKKNHTAMLNCGATSFRIPGLPAEDFPILPPPQPGESVSISQAALKSLIIRTAYAMSFEETRFILNGALLQVQKDRLFLVSTDGRRLACASVSLDNSTKMQLSAVVPAKTVRELGRILENEDTDMVTISPLKDNQLTFSFGSVTVVTRLLDGQFPQYDKVIPAPSKTTMTVDRQLCVNAIRRASLMTTATSQAVVFEVNQDRLIISKESPDIGSAREELPITYSGSPLTIAFNPEFWLDVLKILSDDEVSIEVTGSDKPAVIRQTDFTYIVLPMKVA